MKNTARVIDKMLVLVDAKDVESKLINIGGKLVKITKQQASYIWSFYMDQTPKLRKEFADDMETTKGFNAIFKKVKDVMSESAEITENADIEVAMKSLNTAAANISKKYGYEVYASKSTLGGEINVSYFMKVIGPKSSWTNNIAQNSPLFLTFYIHSGKIEMSLISYQLKNAGGKKMRKTKISSIDDAIKKIEMYLSKEEKNISSILKGDMNEATDYTISHKTFSSAVQHAQKVAEDRGYTVDEYDWDRKIAMGPRKPSKGKTNSYSIDLMKNDKDVRQKLKIQVYYDEGRYELNMYIQ
jgi:hypothetical protein